MALSQIYQRIKASAWLGFQIETNWTRWYYYLLYILATPIFSILIIVMIYQVLTLGKREIEIFYFAYSGTALFVFIVGTLQGLPRIIQEDREDYRTLKYIYLSPGSFYLYLLGRAIPRALLSLLPALLILLLGKLVWGLPLSLNLAGLPWLIAAILLGFLALISAGLILASVALLTAVHHSFYLNESLSSIFYLFCGVIFPLSSLPEILQKIARLIPFTYWTELMRRVLMPDLGVNNGFNGVSTPLLFWEFSGITILLFLLSRLIFVLTIKRVKQKGIIDMNTGH